MTMRTLTESSARGLQRAGAAAATAATRMGGEVRGHRQEMLILLATLGFVVVMALLGLLMITA